MKRIELAYETTLWVVVNLETGKVDSVEVSTGDPSIRRDFPPIDADKRDGDLPIDHPDVVRAVEIAEEAGWPHYSKWTEYR